MKCYTVVKYRLSGPPTQTVTQDPIPQTTTIIDAVGDLRLGSILSPRWGEFILESTFSRSALRMKATEAISISNIVPVSKCSSVGCNTATKFNSFLPLNYFPSVARINVVETLWQIEPGRKLLYNLKRNVFG